MDDELEEILRILVESSESPILVVGDEVERRRVWARAILEARDGIERIAVLGEDDDWERVAGEVEAVVAPDVAAVSEDRQILLLEWVVEGDCIVAAGASDPNRAVREGEVRTDLYYRLAVAPFAVGDIEHGIASEEAIARTLGSDDEQAAGSERAMPPERLAAWAERAGVQPVRSWRHDHLEDGELWTLELGEPSVTEAWHRLRETAESGDGVAVVTSGREAVDELLERQHFGHERISERTADWRLDDWRRAAREVDPADWTDEGIEREIAEGLEASYFEAAPLEAPDRSDEQPSIVERAGESASVTLVPVEEAWEVPAFFHFGGHVGTPRADRHAAMLKHWSERWGATVFGIAFDSLDVYLDEPLRERDQVLEVAREQFVYCTPPIGENIAEVARWIQGARWWSFWWD